MAVCQRFCRSNTLATGTEVVEVCTPLSLNSCMK